LPVCERCVCVCASCASLPSFRRPKPARAVARRRRWPPSSCCERLCAFAATSRTFHLLHCAHLEASPSDSADLPRRCSKPCTATGRAQQSWSRRGHRKSRRRSGHLGESRCHAVRRTTAARNLVPCAYLDRVPCTSFATLPRRATLESRLMIASSAEPSLVPTPACGTSPSAPRVSVYASLHTRVHQNVQHGNALVSSP
jgi:hypothetical protein